jgi:hypothetical protein
MSLTVVQAGKRGGLKLLQTRGRYYFVVIGRKGQEAMRRKYPGMATEWGKLGGRPKKLTWLKSWERRANNNKGGIADLPALCPLPRPIIQHKSKKRPSKRILNRT